MRSAICPECGNVNVSESVEGQFIECPKCGAEIPSAIPPNYPAMKRRLLLLTVRRKLRALCDATGLGPSTGERICCALIVALIPFAISFGLSFAFRQPAGFAALQGDGSFVSFAVCGLLIGIMSDERLSQSKTRLAAELPSAEIAWQEHKERQRAKQEAKRQAE